MVYVVTKLERETLKHLHVYLKLRKKINVKLHYFHIWSIVNNKKKMHPKNTCFTNPFQHYTNYGSVFSHFYLSLPPSFNSIMYLIICIV